MTTNKPGSVNQAPLFYCRSCYEVFPWAAEDLRVYDGYSWCEFCWDEGKREFEDQPDWGDLSHFVPAYKSEIEALQAECDQLRKDAERWRYVRQFLDLDDVGDEEFVLGLTIRAEELVMAVTPHAHRLLKGRRYEYLIEQPPVTVEQAIDAAMTEGDA